MINDAVPLVRVDLKTEETQGITREKEKSMGEKPKGSDNGTKRTHFDLQRRKKLSRGGKVA